MVKFPDVQVVIKTIVHARGEWMSNVVTGHMMLNMSAVTSEKSQLSSRAIDKLKTEIRTKFLCWDIFFKKDAKSSKQN